MAESSGYATNGIVNGINETNSTYSGRPDFAMKETPVENFRSLKVIVIGAGFSGIYCGIRIPQRLRNVDLTIYEKNDGVGGTWYENRYPGCACDVPAHSYQYSFEPNPHWSAFYAPAPEIRAYLEGVVQRYSAHRYIKCGHKVTMCEWDPEKSKWNVTVEVVATGEKFVNVADVVISARGTLNDILWPDVKGLSSFKGLVMHSAAWKDGYNFENKRVGVIGGGSSAIQIVPKLQKIDGIRLSCFVRSKTWISRQFGGAAIEELGLEGTNFTLEQRERFASDQFYYQKFRSTIERDANSVHAMTLKDSSLQKDAKDDFTALMKDRLARKPEIWKSILPGFSVGCRRLTPGPGYLEALVEDNVDFIDTPIQQVHPAGIELKDGRIIELDALICATGFSASAPPPFPVVGSEGRTLRDKFQPYPETYLSMAIDGFPNFFMMLGPNAAIGSGSLTMMIEMEGDYIVKCIRKMQKEDIRRMEVKAARVRDFSQLIDTYFKRTVYLDKCNSWYRNGGRGDRITGLWPGSALHAIETFRSPRWEDFEYEYEGEEDGYEVNQLRWLGNGWSDSQLNNGDLAYYLRPEYLDVPASPFPETTAYYQTRAFSY